MGPLNIVIFLFMLKTVFLPTLYSFYLGLPCSSDGKESACNAGEKGSFLDWKDPLEKGRKDPLEKGKTIHSMFLPGESRGQTSLAVYNGVAKSPTRLSN